MPQALRVHDQLRTGGQRDAILDARVGAVLAEDEVAVLVIGQVEEAPDDPAGAVGVQTVVVILVEVVEAVAVAVRLQLDDPAAADVRTGLLRPTRKSRGDRRLGVDPDSVLVGPRRLVVPESVALDVAERARKRREAGVSGGLPVDILDVEPFLGVDLFGVAVEDDETLVLEGGGLDVSHDLNHVLSTGASTFLQALLRPA
ncbi:hypothetical protein ABE10_26240 [Bacillus toyonensis]|nr:hypothetical protein [Bacillus toyonensis]